MNRDALSGFALLAIAGAYYWATGAIADSSLEDEVGAGGLPRMLSVALAALGLILLVRGFLTARASVAEDEVRLPRAFGVLLFGVAYVVLLPHVGYVVTTALLIASVALYEGAERRWTLPLASLGGALLYWAVFVKLLGVKQPAGALWLGLL